MKNVDKSQIVIKAPIEKIKNYVTSRNYEGQILNLEGLKDFGVFILKGALDNQYIKKLYEEYELLINNNKIRKDDYHRTQVRISEDQKFTDILRSNQFIELSRNIFQHGAALDFMRIVKKDESNPAPVFLHSDSMYNIGWFDAYSCFIPLTHCNQENGGLSFYPGTHNYGHLGDAGGIASILPLDYPKLCPDVYPGDIIIMHAGTWHESGPHIGNGPRVYLEFAIRDSLDPASKKLIHGIDEREWVLTISVDDLFSDSREQRIRKLSNKK
jgi:hypothetical protein